MKEERMAILKMVEDGKINADDAVKLLDAVSKTGKKNFDNADFDAKIKTFAKNMDEMGREVGKRLEEIGKDVEPKLRKVAQTIIEKTNECASDIACTLKKSDCCGEENEDGGCCCQEDGEAEGCCSEESNESSDIEEKGNEN